MPGGSASEGGSASGVGAASGRSLLPGRSASEEGVCICGVCLQVVEVLHGRGGGLASPPKYRKVGGTHLTCLVVINEFFPFIVG